MYLWKLRAGGGDDAPGDLGGATDFGDFGDYKLRGVDNIFSFSIGTDGFSI